jgi:site-specific DNA-methyltransferase (cytosine-N4-specific)
MAKRKIRRSDLPFGSEFSPSQICLARVLEMAEEAAGDWRDFERRVRAEYFESHETSDYNRGKLANNAKLGMQAYGIIDDDARLTAFGRELSDMLHDEQRLYERLARHILLNLHGVTLIQCILDMQAAGEQVTLQDLRRWLEERGIHFPPGGKHPSMMRLWLEKAGVFREGWRVDEGRFRELMGISMEDVESLAGLTPEQRAFLQALANTGVTTPQASNELARLAEATYGVRFDEKALPKQVLGPLEAAGYIRKERTTGGRGAKPFLVTGTEKLVAEVVEPLLDQLGKQTAADIRPLLRKPLGEILRDIKHGDRHRKGLALEALAFKLMRLIDLDYVATRLRGRRRAARRLTSSSSRAGSSSPGGRCSARTRHASASRTWPRRWASRTCSGATSS